MSRSARIRCTAASLAFACALPAVVSAQVWEVIVCNPLPTCQGDCRPWAIARQPGSPPPQGCSPAGTFPSFELAKRNADVMSGKPPSMPSPGSFEFYMAESERLRQRGDMINARNMLQNAASRASSLEDSLYVSSAFASIGDMPAALNAATRARDLASRRAQFQIVGDAFMKLGRADLAQQMYDRARTATQ
jgi:hypothetical protein